MTGTTTEGTFGIYFPDTDLVMSDSHMHSEADAMRAVHGYGLEQAAQFGVLVEKVDGEWTFRHADGERWKLLYFGELRGGGLESDREAGVGT